MDSVFRTVKNLLIDEPFYGLFLLGLNKRFDNTIETAAVGIDGINPVLLINRDFWYGLSDEMKKGVIKHECNHILLQHLTTNWDYLKQADSVTFNKAADCECNSYIPVLQTDPYCYPSRFGLENAKGTLYYFEKITDDKNSGQNNDNSSENEPQILDDHSKWETASDAQRQLVQQQIDAHTKNVAEQVQKSCGSIPGQFKEYIDGLFKVKPRIFDWKKYFRRYLGSVIDIELKKSRKKESVRFPDCAGIRHKRKSQILVVVDTSGSISKNDLCDFFSEVHHIHKAGAIIDIIEIDTKIQRQYRYNGKWDMQASGRGGTILKEAVEYYNAHRRDYSSCVFFTDGYCDVNFKIGGDCMWIIASGGSQQKYPGRVCYIGNLKQN
jgi:predicted metal-dependent peptidase